jgi:hypothetical protein
VSPDPDFTHDEETDEARIQSVLERARAGDREALPELRRILDERPGIWKHYGALAAHARNAWIGLISGADLALQESLDRQAEALKQELTGTDSSPLETLLIERIVACWLQMAFADLTAARAGEISLAQSNEIRKRQDSAHRRYITAVGALAMTRRLLGSGAPRVTAPREIDKPTIDLGDPVATEEDGQILAYVRPTQSGTISAERPEEAVKGG